MGKIMRGEKKLCSIEKGSPALGVAAREGSGGASPEEGWGRKGTRAPRTPPYRGTLPSSVLGGRLPSSVLAERYALTSQAACT